METVSEGKKKHRLLTESGFSRIICFGRKIVVMIRVPEILGINQMNGPPAYMCVRMHLHTHTDTRGICVNTLRAEHISTESGFDYTALW